MKRDNSASLEARIRNSKELVQFVKGFALYSPTADELKPDRFEEFAGAVIESVTPLKEAFARMKISSATVNSTFARIVKTSKDIRSEIFEIKGRDSDEWRQVNNIVRVITGQNVQAHSKRKKAALKNLKEGDEKPVFNSVSERDHKSMLGNFRSLIALVKSYEFYNPSDPEIAAAALERLEADTHSVMADAADRETEYLMLRSKLLHDLNDANGLKDRVMRAKYHIRRKYGIKSPEFKVLSGKTY